jgi:hypothetical protein
LNNFDSVLDSKVNFVVLCIQKPATLRAAATSGALASKPIAKTVIFPLSACNRSYSRYQEESKPPDSKTIGTSAISLFG